jgi:hypothetical protein
MGAFCRLCLNFCFQSYNASRLEPVQLMEDTKALGLLTSRLASNPNLLSLEYHFRCVDRLTRPHHPVTHLAGANVAAAPASLRNKMALGTRPQFFRAVNRRGHLLQPLCGPYCRSHIWKLAIPLWGRRAQTFQRLSYISCFQKTNRTRVSRRQTPEGPFGNFRDHQRGPQPSESRADR